MSEIYMNNMQKTPEQQIDEAVEISEEIRKISLSLQLIRCIVLFSKRIYIKSIIT